MPTTLNAGLRYPAASSAPDVPGDLYNLALDTDNAFKSYADGTTAIQYATNMQSNSSYQNQLLRHVSGLVVYSFGIILTTGTFNDGTQILTVPAGYRPQSRVYFTANGANNDATTRRPAGGWLEPNGIMYVDFFGGASMTRIQGGVPPYKAYA